MDLFNHLQKRDFSRIQVGTPLDQWGGRCQIQFFSILLGLALSPAASANTIISWHYWGEGVDAHLILTLEPLTGPGMDAFDFYVTGIAGDRNGQPVVGLAPTTSPGAVTFVNSSGTAGDVL